MYQAEHSSSWTTRSSTRPVLPRCTSLCSAGYFNVTTVHESSDDPSEASGSVPLPPPPAAGAVSFEPVLTGVGFLKCTDAPRKARDPLVVSACLRTEASSACKFARILQQTQGERITANAATLFGIWGTMSQCNGRHSSHMFVGQECRFSELHRGGYRAICIHHRPL